MLRLVDDGVDRAFERCGAQLSSATNSSLPDGREFVNQLCNLPKGHSGPHGLLFGQMRIDGRLVEGIPVPARGALVRDDDRWKR
jgi:hypothetical protein